ncbi:MAG: ATP-dependent Clp protease ATP-binding subunit [Bradymonadaceae bacterium]|nr:ATP-dependent Clp protease ATP-binding subunit [Lujinxingiaceae bacterium]
MAKQTRRVEVYLHQRPDWVYGEVLGANELGAAGSSVEEVLGRLGRLAEEGLKMGQVRAVSATSASTTRQIRVEIPVLSLGRIEMLALSLFAICRSEEALQHVYLPQLGVDFTLTDPSQLELIALEQIRARYELEERLGAMAQQAGGPTSEELRAAGSTMEVRTIEVRFDPKAAIEAPEEETYPTLAAVAEPMHRLLDKKDAPKAFERRAEVETLLNYLGGHSERSVLLTGPPGVGKSVIIQDVVGRILAGDVPETLKGVGVWQISGGRLMAGMRFLGQWQERVINLIEEVKTSGAVLFAENLIELLESSGTEQHVEGIPGLLLPHILSGDIVLVTEARPEQLSLAEQKHPSFLRALRRLPIEPLPAAETDRVLDRVSFRLGRQHGVRLSVEARQKILELTGRFRGAGAFPGPAVELAERMARTHRTQAVAEDGQPRLVLLAEHAVEAYASLTGLPKELLDASSEFHADEVRSHFAEAIYGQPEGVEAMVDLVTVLRAGLNPPARPLGSYLFLGPTGVGKTQTALTLARYLFASHERVIRFDMSEYQDSWSAARLVGRYKGQPGELVRRIREQPFQVILFDEIEKAHATVFDFLLQILGEGRLTDALGQTVSVTSAVVIMTSNLGAGGPSSLGFEGGNPDAAREAVGQHYRGVVEEFFRPEFVGRIDRIIAFRSLGSETARSLVERALKEAFSREGLVRRLIRVSAEPAVVDYLIKIGFDERYGARPLRQSVESYIIAPLANFLSRESDVREVDLLFRMVDGAPLLDLV